MIRFYSTAAADFLTFEPLAMELLEAAGRIAAPRGAIGDDETAAALARLRDSVAQRVEPAPEAEHEEEELPAVSWRQRAFPLIDMLERAQRKGVAVLWESC